MEKIPRLTAKEKPNSLTADDVSIRRWRSFGGGGRNPVKASDRLRLFTKGANSRKTRRVNVSVYKAKRSDFFGNGEGAERGA